MKLYFKIPLPKASPPEPPTGGSTGNGGVSRRFDLRSRSDQRVKMWMEVEKLAECVDGPDHARCDVPAVQDGAVDLEHRLPGDPGELAEKPPVEAEEDP